jgi:hypothetical protein
MIEEDELYVVHLVEDTVPISNVMQLCRDWGTAMQVARGYMSEVCSEDWEEHVVDPFSSRWLKAKWTWGLGNEIKITVENVL